MKKKSGTRNDPSKEEAVARNPKCEKLKQGGVIHNAKKGDKTTAWEKARVPASDKA